jgi:hypothetical protein
MRVSRARIIGVVEGILAGSGISRMGGGVVEKKSTISSLGFLPLMAAPCSFKLVKGGSFPFLLRFGLSIRIHLSLYKVQLGMGM